MFLLVATASWAAFPPVNFTEEDGSPSVYPYKVKVSNGALTDNGDNTVTISTSGGITQTGLVITSSSGIKVSGDGILQIDAIEGLYNENINIDLQTNSNDIVIGSTTSANRITFTGLNVFLQGAGQQIIWEGSTVDQFDMTLAASDPTTTRTLTLPDKSGDVATTSGATTAGNCAEFDADGNIVDAGGACFGAGTGDVVGPGSSTNNVVVRFDGVTGKLIQAASGVTIDDSNNIVTTGSMTATSYVSSGSGISTLNQGLIVNDNSGGTANDDFIAETNSDALAFQVDASADKIFMTVPLDVTNDPIRSAGLSTTGITVGINQWDDANDKVDGNEIGDDTIDEDALDSGFLHLQVHSAKLGGACAVNGDAANATGPGIDSGESAWMILFDDDEDEGACWQFVMPETYNGGAVDVRLLYKHVATSCEVTWEVAWCADSDGETVETVGCSAYNTTTVTTPGTQGLLDTATVAFTNSADAGSVVKGDLVQLQVSTDADGGAGVDDCVGDSELLGVLVEW